MEQGAVAGLLLGHHLDQRHQPMEVTSGDRRLLPMAAQIPGAQRLLLMLDPAAAMFGAARRPQHMLVALMRQLQAPLPLRRLGHSMLQHQALMHTRHRLQLPMHPHLLQLMVATVDPRVRQHHKLADTTALRLHRQELTVLLLPQDMALLSKTMDRDMRTKMECISPMISMCVAGRAFIWRIGVS